jgi:hypothetical protein
MDAFKKRGGDWSTYEADFLQLMRDRRVEDAIDPVVLDNGSCCAARTNRTTATGGWSPNTCRAAGMTCT